MPIHMYADVDFTTKMVSGVEVTCLTPLDVMTNPIQDHVLLTDYGSDGFSSTRTVDVYIPDLGSANGFVYINIHLDYGLKDTTYWSKGLDGNAVNTGATPPYPYPTIVNPTNYTFADGITVQSRSTASTCSKRTRGSVGWSPILAGLQLQWVLR